MSSSCGVGSSNVKIKIQDNPRPDDGFGGQDNLDASWADKFETWATMEQQSGGEVFSNRQTESRAMYLFTMDFPLGSKTVLTTDRVLVGSRTFNVRKVKNPGQRNRKLEVTAEEGVSD